MMSVQIRIAVTDALADREQSMKVLRNTNEQMSDRKSEPRPHAIHEETGD